MNETKKQQVQRLCRDEIIRNVAERGIAYLPPEMVEAMTQKNGRTPRAWFVEESARYYEWKRGPESFSYPDAPALAVLRTREEILAWESLQS